MKKFKFSKILMVAACLGILISMVCKNEVLVFADVKPKSVEVKFSELYYQKRSTTTEIKGIYDISEISVNTGKVSYEISGDKVKISVSEGRESRVGPHTKTVTVTDENTYANFPKKIPYKFDGYIGDLVKTNSGYDSEKKLYWATYKGNVTKAECYFYSYNVTYSYTLNVTPQLALTSPDNADAVKDKIDIKGFVKDENISDELIIYYAFDDVNESTEYKSQITSDGTDQNIDGTIDITSLEDGVHTLYMWAVDKRGVKSATVETEITVDTVAPITPTLMQEPTSPTNESVSVGVYYPDDAAVREVRIDDGSWVQFEDVAKDGKIVMDENGTVEARALDLAGNVSEIGELNVTNIEKIVPEKPVIPWYLWTQDGAAATGKRVPTGYNVNCTSKGTAVNHIQLITWGINVEKGKTYKLSFMAKSEGGIANPLIELMQKNSPWFVYSGRRTVKIGSEWKNYEVYFTSNNTDSNARITFYLGNKMSEGSGLYIESLSMVEVK